jgi:hypothetical protein
LGTRDEFEKAGERIYGYISEKRFLNKDLARRSLLIEKNGIKKFSSAKEGLLVCGHH